MSWSVNAIGKPPAVAAKIAADLNQYKCIEPEETVKQAVGAAIAAALAAQSPIGVVRVVGGGNQYTEYGPDGKTVLSIRNTLDIKVEPLYGFVE